VGQTGEKDLEVGEGGEVAEREGEGVIAGRVGKEIVLREGRKWL
jgi:hypothetical protein